MPGISVAIAIAVGLVSSFVQSLGLTIQRKSHVQDEALPLAQRRRPIRRPLWLLGFGIYITSNIFSTIFQLDALPIVILAPLGAVSLIYNALLARVILGDTFGKGAILGTGLVAAGAVLIAVFGVVEEREHSLNELLRLFQRPPFVAFFSIEAFVIVVALVTAHVAAWSIHRQLRPKGIKLPEEDSDEHDFQANNDNGRTTPPPSTTVSNYASPHDPPAIPFRSPKPDRRWSAPIVPPAAVAAGKHVHFTSSPKQHHPCHIPLPSPPLSGIPSATLVPSPKQTRSLTLIGLAFAAASGVLSGMSLILAKAAVELLVLTLDWWHTGRGENQFVRAESWILVGGLVIGALLQLVYLNYSLTFASPALICPLAFCFFNLSSIFDGLVFYDQFGRLAIYQIVLVSLGVLVLLIGVWVVSAIQPTGQGGVDMGTWVEEEDDEEMDWRAGAGQEEESPLLGSETHRRQSAPAAAAAAGQESPPRILTYAQPHPHSPTSPETPVFAESPMVAYPDSPMSPTTSANARRRRRTRYGTLVPEFAPAGAPTGFSIGLGAASPGFVLRPAGGGSFSHGQGHRGRSRSEDVRGIQAIMRGDAVSAAPHGLGADDGGVAVPELENRGEAEVRRWHEDEAGHDDTRRRRQSWFSRLLGGEQRGRIRLQDDAEDGGDAGD